MLLRIRLVHQRNFARDSGPLEFAAERLVASLTLKLLPLKEFVGESKVRLDYNIQAPGSDEAAGKDQYTVYARRFASLVRVQPMTSRKSGHSQLLIRRTFPRM
jgi:hypothetical protein